MIRGYPQEPSVFPGETLHLHVASDSPDVPFRVHFYRQGRQLAWQMSSARLVASYRPLEPPDQDWTWPSFAFAVPAHWPSGVYLAIFVEEKGDAVDGPAPDPADPAPTHAQALFVVRNPHPGGRASILYKLPLFTYQAYNSLGNPPGCLYPLPSTQDHSPVLTLRRPGGGAGGQPIDAYIPDAFDLSSPRQVFAHWDAPFIRWLEQNGYAVDYCTDLDVHRSEPPFLVAYRLLLSVGHDEYWSETMRNHVEAFVRGGGNVAFFSGNTCWFRVRVEDEPGRLRLTCYKHLATALPEGDPNRFTVEWHRPPSRRPENSMTGVSVRKGGQQGQGKRPAVGYTVQGADHWVYQGTGLKNGDVFGAEDRLVGYECDGADTVGFDGRTGQGFAVPTGGDGTPTDFLILGVGFLGRLHGWHTLDAHPAATMGTYRAGGIVFTAATTDWPRVLSAGHPSVDRITRNALDHLQVRGLPIISPESDGQGVAGQVVELHVDPAPLRHHADLRYHWSVTDGASVVSERPEFSVRLPSSPLPVTVTVTVTTGDERVGFGMRTFTVHSLRIEATPSARPLLSVVVPCMGRLHHLKLSAPHLLVQEGVEYILVDYSCPDRCGDHARQHWPGAKVVSVPGQQYFNKSRALNAGIRAATAPWLAILDADMVVAHDFAAQALAAAGEDGFLCNVIVEGISGGFLVCRRSLLAQTGGYDERIEGWGCEDNDMCRRLLDLGLKARAVPHRLMRVIAHDRAESTRHYREKDRFKSARANRALLKARSLPDQRTTWHDSVLFGLPGPDLRSVWKAVQYAHFVQRLLRSRVRLYAQWHGWPGHNFRHVPYVCLADQAAEVASVLDTPAPLEIVTEAPLEEVCFLPPWDRWHFDCVPTRVRWRGWTHARRRRVAVDLRSEAGDVPTARHFIVEQLPALLAYATHHEMVELNPTQSLAQCVETAAGCDIYVGQPNAMTEVCYAVGVPVFLVTLGLTAQEVVNGHGDRPFLACNDVADFVAKARPFLGE